MNITTRQILCVSLWDVIKETFKNDKEHDITVDIISAIVTEIIVNSDIHLTNDKSSTVVYPSYIVDLINKYEKYHPSLDVKERKALNEKLMEVNSLNKPHQTYILID